MLVAVFYLPPPVAGQPSDGFPQAVGHGSSNDIPASAQAERLFVLVLPLKDQVPADATRVSGVGLQCHAIRRPMVGQRGTWGRGDRRIQLPVTFRRVPYLRGSACRASMSSGMADI
jgi:hypothetical protein